MLGNATSGVAVALSTVLSGLSDGRDAIEARLALGATRWEATHDLLAASLRTGLTPVLNQMSIIGLVSIPGALARPAISQHGAISCRHSCSAHLRAREHFPFTAQKVPQPRLIRREIASSSGQA